MIVSRRTIAKGLSLLGLSAMIMGTQVVLAQALVEKPGPAEVNAQAEENIVAREVERLPFDVLKFEHHLQILGLTKDSPRFESFLIKHKDESKEVANAFDISLYSDFFIQVYSDVKNLGVADWYKQYGPSILFDRESLQKIEDLELEIQNEQNPDKKLLINGELNRVIEDHILAAAKHNLIFNIHAGLMRHRRAAAVGLMGILNHYPNTLSNSRENLVVPRELALDFRDMLFSQCTKLDDCLELLEYLPQAIEEEPAIFSDSQFVNSLSENLEELKVFYEPELHFLFDLIKVRLYSFQAFGKFYDFSGVNLPHMRGITPFISVGHTSEIRRDIQKVISKGDVHGNNVGLFPQIINSLKQARKAQLNLTGPEKEKEAKLIDAIPDFDILLDAANKVFGDIDKFEKKARKSNAEEKQISEHEMLLQSRAGKFTLNIYEGVAALKGLNSYLLVASFDEAVANQNRARDTDTPDRILSVNTITNPVQKFIVLNLFARFEIPAPQGRVWSRLHRESAAQLKQWLKQQPKADVIFQLFFQEKWVDSEVEKVTKISKNDSDLKTQMVKAHGLRIFGGLGKELEAGIPDQSELEILANRNFPLFRSLTYQLLKVQESSRKLLMTNVAFIEAVGALEKGKAAEKLTAAQLEYHESLLLTECYGFHAAHLRSLQMENKGEQGFSSKIPTEFILKDHKSGQVIYRENLRDVCGSDRNHLEASVVNHFNHVRLEGMPRTDAEAWAQELLRNFGNVYIVSAAGKMSFATIQAVSGSTKAALGNILRANVAAGASSAVAQSAVKRFIVNPILWGTRFTAAQAINVTVFTFYYRLISGSLHEAKEYAPSLLSHVPSQKFYEPNPNPKASTAETFWDNYGQDFMFGMAFGILSPLAHKLALKQVSAGSVFPFRHKLTSAQIEHIHQVKGLETYVDYLEKPISTYGRAYSIYKEFGYTFLPAAYSTAMFASVDYGERTVSYYVFGSKEHPWQGYEDFTESLRRGAFMSAGFTGIRMFGLVPGAPIRFLQGSRAEFRRYLKENPDRAPRVLKDFREFKDDGSRPLSPEMGELAHKSQQSNAKNYPEFLGRRKLTVAHDVVVVGQDVVAVGKWLKNRAASRNN